MSDALAQATFLPAKPPKAGILDFSDTLSTGQVGALEAYTHAPGFAAKVVVLPKNFSPADINEFGAALANQWRVSGDRMLMVVDVKSHKVRAYVGHDLEKSGLTRDVMNTDVIRDNFIPHMKTGDLSGAIQSSLTTAQQHATARTDVAAPSTRRQQEYQSAPTYAPGYTHAPPPGIGIGGFAMWSLIILVVGGAGYYFISRASRKKDNARLSEEFKNRIGPLYERADQIGSSSEYLKTADHPDLAKRIAEFFNKLTTLEKAVSEVESLEKRNKVWEVRDGYLKIVRWVSILQPEADKLKEEVFALTGGVQTVPEISQRGEIEPPASQGERNTVTIPERFRDQMQYRRPEWSYQPAYYQPVDNGSSLMMMSMMLNQWEMNRQLSDMNHNINHGGGYWYQGGGDWDQRRNSDNNSSSDFGSSWGDSGGGGGFDSSGGDWGGGGDSGGGGDFGSSGGDW